MGKNDDVPFREKLFKRLKQPEIVSMSTAIEAVMQVIKENGKTNWYIMNADIVNMLGITGHDVIYVFGTANIPTIVLKDRSVIFIVQRNPISKDIIPYLQLLDLTLLFRKISKKNLKEALAKYREVIANLSGEEKKLLVKLARKYTPFTRSALALILGSLDEIRLSSKLSESLNPEIIKKYREKLMFAF
ncbi:hypothetical protein ACLOAU_19065 [Niabella sp. CJ426]|uniref:hypothetical protein n=1 Tax=Niabella sp. CJ426 TaxID=3393740 RepID=UPI003D017AE8